MRQKSAGGNLWLQVSAKLLQGAKNVVPLHRLSDEEETLLCSTRCRHEART